MTQTITIKDPKAPATPSQLSYLKSLVEKRNLPEVCERYQLAVKLGALTKGGASSLIDQLLKAPMKTSQTNTVQDWGKAKTVQAEAAQAEVPKPQLTECPAWGYYDIDGKIYCWSVTSKDAFPTLRVFSAPYWGGVKWTWKKASYASGKPAVKAQGTWTPYAGKGYYGKNAVQKTSTVQVPGVLAEAVANGIKPMTIEELGAKGKQLNFCVKCGAQLTDPVSVAQGIGPVCIKTIHQW
jgi:hypothetical protein